MEYDKYHSLVNVVDKNINIAFVHRELLEEEWNMYAYAAALLSFLNAP